jgi:RHS repeat-associated protein
MFRSRLSFMPNVREVGTCLVASEVASAPDLYYYRARYYDSSVGRFISEDHHAITMLGEWPGLYVYAKNDPINLVDPLGLFTLKPGVPYPSLPIQALVDCIEFRTMLPIQITSTTDSHDPNTPHTNGVAVDLHYDNPAATKSILCAAARCGAGFGLDEKVHPSSPKVAPHIHLQIPAGKKGGHGDLPPANCHDCER